MKQTIFLFVIILTAGLSLKGQEKWAIDSPYLNQTDTVLIFKPDSYNATKSYPLVYLLHGYSANYAQWSQTIDCKAIANQYNLIIVCPEGFTSYYLNSPHDKDSQYEDFFFKNLVPKVHENLRIDDKNIFISGLSMGGYGALRFFILHPEYFNTAGSTSGAIEIDFENFNKTSQLFWKSNRMTDDLTQMLGNPSTNDWNKYSIVSLLKEKPDFKKPFIFDCGTDDILYPNALKLKEYADIKNIPATFISQPGGHTTNYWSKSILFHFIYFQQNMK